MDRRFGQLLTTTGIAETSALQILGELAVLPDMLDTRTLWRMGRPCRRDLIETYQAQSRA